jgi:hypothetical protein
MPAFSAFSAFAFFHDDRFPRPRSSNEQTEEQTGGGKQMRVSASPLRL